MAYNFSAFVETSAAHPYRHVRPLLCTLKTSVVEYTTESANQLTFLRSPISSSNTLQTVLIALKSAWTLTLWLLQHTSLMQWFLRRVLFLRKGTCVRIFFFVNLLPWQSSIFCLCSLSGASQNNKFLLFAFKLNSVLQANLVAKAARWNYCKCEKLLKEYSKGFQWNEKSQIEHQSNK